MQDASHDRMSLQDFFNLFKEKKKSKHKYNAKSVRAYGMTFPSTAEYDFHEYCLLLQKAGTLLFFLNQVPLRLPSGTKLIIDFLLFYADGRIEFIDVKGLITPLFKLKKKEIEGHNPHIRIKIAKKKGKGWTIN